MGKGLYVHYKGGVYTVLASAVKVTKEVLDKILELESKKKAEAESLALLGVTEWSFGSISKHSSVILTESEGVVVDVYTLADGSAVFVYDDENFDYRDTEFVLYRGSKEVYLRPSAMFFGNEYLDGKGFVKRFTKVTL